MDSFEFNKIAGAVLAAALVVFGSRTLINEVLHVPEPEKPGYEVAVMTTEGDGVGAAKDAGPSVVELLASADAGAGKKDFKKCVACHTIEKGGANKIGPNLNGVVGRELASVSGFAYSAGLKGKGGSWDYVALDSFLTSPKKYAPGTKMAFAGLKKAQDRAELIAYLRENTDSPPPLPEASESAEAGESSEVAPATAKE